MIILAAVLVAAVAFAVRQRENLKLLYSAKTSSTEEIVVKAETSKQEQQKVLKDKGVDVAPPSLEQLDGLLDGKTSADDVKQSLGLTDSPRSTEPAQPPSKPEQKPQEYGTNPEEKTSEQTETAEQRAKKAQEYIDQCVKALYAYEVDLMSDLGALKQQAIDEYTALPPEKQTKQTKADLGLKYLNICYDMEVEADGKVQGLLKQLRSDLTAIGAETDIADTLWKHYCEEKATAKEYYLSKYL